MSLYTPTLEKQSSSTELTFYERYLTLNDTYRTFLVTNSFMLIATFAYDFVSIGFLMKHNDAFTDNFDTKIPSICLLCYNILSIASIIMVSYSYVQKFDNDGNKFQTWVNNLYEGLSPRCRALYYLSASCATACWIWGWIILSSKSDNDYDAFENQYNTLAHIFLGKLIMSSSVNIFQMIYILGATIDNI